MAKARVDADDEGWLLFVTGRGVIIADADMGVGVSTEVSLFALDAKEGIVSLPLLFAEEVDPVPVPLIFSLVI